MMLTAEPLLLDLSRHHNLDEILDSKLDVREIPSIPGRRQFSFKNQEIQILLPGGRSINQYVELGVIDAEKGLLRRISITGRVMPQAQAFHVATNFHESFNIPTDKLKAWSSENKDNAISRRAFGTTAGWDYYPRTSLAVESSGNKLYPWVIRCLIEWGRNEQEEWSEERVWEELSPPAKPKISLNPPSGLTYDRKDAYKEIREEQEAYERELAEQGITLPHLQPTPGLSDGIPNEGSKPKENNTPILLLPIIIICFLSLLIIMGIKYLSKR